MTSYAIPLPAFAAQARAQVGEALHPYAVT